MKTGHTPGKWSQDRNIILDLDSNEVATVTYRQSGYVQANARLIAAAPRLENALRSVLCNLALAEKEGRDIGGYGRLAIQAAESALADI